ncbi:MAG: CRISPR-associated protein Cas4 [Chloroflexi bacterium]|nr:CRISPR-associated protein Cas4 [Chloroflexota bacterium]
MAYEESVQIDLQAPFQVTDLKQWVYCPRILYYSLCLPDVRPVTYSMKAGIEEGQSEEGREVRRSLRCYGLTRGRRAFNVALSSDRLGLRGIADMVIWIDDAPGEVIPVDYKLSETAGEHFQMQLAAYGLLLEESSGLCAKRGFLYEIPRRKAVEVKFTPRLRNKVLTTLECMRRMLWTELMPEPTDRRARCLSCEFRRFCNDVL